MMLKPAAASDTVNVGTTVAELCADRPAPRTEIFSPNAWYGAARAIQRYCGWPESRPLPIVLPHGVETSAHRIWDAEIANRLPAIYSFPAYRDAVLRNATSKAVVPGCSPWLYVDRPPPASERRTVLLMPAHSSHRITTSMDHDRLLRRVAERFGGEPVECCMYWRDVQLGHHDAYSARGIPIVTAGHMHDPAFFNRLAAIFARTRLLVTNEFGSHVFYAAAHGVSVIVWPDIVAEWQGDDVARRQDCFGDDPDPAFLALADAFLTSDPDTAQQASAAGFMLGKDRMLSPNDLNQLLEELWQTPGFHSRVLLQWRLRRSLDSAHSFVRRVRPRLNR
jgi:hypothetical protein